MTVPAALHDARPPAPSAPSDPSASTAPLAGAYARMSAVFPGLGVRQLADGEPAPRGPGWVAAEDLAAGGAALDAFLAWDSAQVLRDYGQRARQDVVASFGLHRYAWPACLLVTVPWFLERRVPRLPVEDVAYQRSRGRMAVRVRGFACLPGDPAAALPAALVVADEDALRAEVRNAVAEHLEPVLDGFGPRMRRGRRALWGMATDEIVEGLWYVAHLLGEERRAMAELAALLPGTTRPYVGTAGFRELTGPSGEPLPTRDRASCCMFYTLRPEDTCVTCPRTCDADRVRRLAARD
ncbi:(2Fe-2S)-binding protein [Streptomyces spongiicola]|uniref:(2Fe-2S)-binding protein n=1 Tax=Streptomyces spongiicola TaxID=1690221 RepID=UPI003F4D3BA0